MGKTEGKLGTGPGQTQQAQDSPRSSPGQAWNRPGTGPGQVLCHIIQTARRPGRPGIADFRTGESGFPGSTLKNISWSWLCEIWIFRIPVETQISPGASWDIFLLNPGNLDFPDLNYRGCSGACFGYWGCSGTSFGYWSSLGALATGRS